jgi:hypothetical protein
MNATKGFKKWYKKCEETKIPIFENLETSRNNSVRSQLSLFWNF